MQGQSSFKITNYNPKQGLSNSSVYDIIKDKEGFLWISTELGINKFDGKNFNKFTANSHNLPDNMVTHSAIVNDNTLFFSTGTSGYFKFDIKKEKVLPTAVKSPSILHKSHNIKTYNNKVYILSVHSIYILVFDLSKNKITDSICFNQEKIFDFNFDTKGELVAATSFGLATCKNKKIIPYVLDGVNLQYNKPIHTFMVQNRKAYFSDGTTLFVYDYDQKKIIESVIYSTTEKSLGKLFIDESDNAWFCTQFLSELYYYNFKTNELINFDPFVSGTDNSITSIMQDDEDNIWIGSYSTGLYKISHSAFISQPSLSTSNVYRVAVIDSNHYALAIKNGLNILNNASSELKNIKFNPSDKDYIYEIKKIKNHILVLNQLQNNVKVNNPVAPVFFLKARSICLLNDTLFLLGGWANDIHLARFKNDRVDTLQSVSFSNIIIKKSRVNCFLNDHSGNIWCGMDDGLLISSGGNLSNFKKINEPALNCQIIDIVESKNGTLYIATNKGLFKYFKNTLSQIKELNGRLIEKTNSLCKDLNDNIYAGTLDGLFKIRPNSSSEYFGLEDGLNSNEINRLAFNPFRNSILVSTNQGLSELNFSVDKLNKKHIPRLHFDKLTSSGKISYKNEVYELEKGNVSIQFSSICFTRVNSIIYKRVIDNGAEILIENSIIELAALNYGKHNIKIYASNDGKNWSEPLEINLLVITPFYFEVWFLLLLGAIFCFFVWLYLRSRIRKIRIVEHKKTEIEQKMISLKYEALNASINPHFIFNALNSVQHYINTNRNDEASDYLAKFGNLIRDALESAEDHFITLDQEKRRLSLYVELEQLRFNNSFTFEFIIEDSINKFETKIPNMLLQPLIENAIIHGFKQIDYKGGLSVCVFKEIDSLKIIIGDNGRGLSHSTNTFITKPGKTKSIGMKNVQERLATIPGATFNLYNKADLSQESGVLIVIEIPIIN